jgi:hypothetical protein
MPASGWQPAADLDSIRHERRDLGGQLAQGGAGTGSKPDPARSAPARSSCGRSTGREALPPSSPISRRSTHRRRRTPLVWDDDAPAGTGILRGMWY